MSIKMIVTDLDGTLLKTDKSISDYTKTILEKCQKSGIKVVYATGRGGSAKKVAPSEFFNGEITMNGAVARIGDDVIYNRLIPYQTARPILLACNKRGIKITSEISGMHYSNFVVSDFWSYLTNFRLTDFSPHKLDAEKLYSPAPTPEEIQFINQLLPDNLYSVMNYDITGILLSIMHKDATKSKAVAELARVWGISSKDIVAFGDEGNDIDLLEYAGVGVAVGNALDEVKSIANHICDTNDNDGMAKWLEENVQ
ncbi:MAG: Cof-type HAD-IIB family hydrolase [Defluviitaleaceae bacterium]|nr:Cof-type HAD-IIB family hydrolase [Defluviitaleaceae bacterium]